MTRAPAMINVQVSHTLLDKVERPVPCRCDLPGGAVSRLWIWPLLFLAAALLPAAALPQPVPQRIVAVGDIHGDHDAWQAIARTAGMIDAKGRWAGGKGTLIQVGDVVDRGPDSLKILRHLMKLQREAQRKGGRVIALVGNHEAMMMIGDLRYVHPGEFAAFATRDSKAVRERVYQINRAAIEAAYRASAPQMTTDSIKEAWLRTMPLGRLEYESAWAPAGELGKWALSNPAVVKLGGTLFVHGGISSAFAGLQIDEINRQTTVALKAREQSPAAIINHPQGPLWYRGLISRGDGDEATVAPIPPGATAPLTIEQEIELVLKNYGVKRIVVGHTPAREGIIGAAGGRLWRIDSAISRAYEGTPSYLEIIGDRVIAHRVARPPGQPWSPQ